MKETNFQKDKKSHWQSYELRGSQEERELQKQEFFTSPDPIIAKIKAGDFDRKTFLKFMGASVAMASLNCVQKPVEKIVPYVNLNKPDEGENAQYDFVKHGHSYHYASVCGACSAGCGTIVKARDGRPLKLEGNPNHPVSQGALCSSGQVAIFDLYDPDRVQDPHEVKNGKFYPSDWVALNKAITAVLADNKGKTRILSKSLPSPSSKAITEDFLKSVGGGKVYESELTFLEDAISLGQELSYGKAIVPNYHFDKAKVILSIDADFLGTWLSPVEFQKDFSKRRTLVQGKGDVNTFIAAESNPTTTGSNADQRIAIKPGDQRKLALAVAKALSDLGLSGASGVGGINVEATAKELGVTAELIRSTARALNGARGASLVVAGGAQAGTKDAVDLQIAVNMINSMLGNDGKTIDSSSVRFDGKTNYYANLLALKKELDAGQVGLLVINDLNLIYNLPNAEEWKASLKKAALVVQVTSRIDETASSVGWVVPKSHFLESWSDSSPVTGLFAIQQPTVRPLFNSKSFEDAMIDWAGGSIAGSKNFYEYIQNKWKGRGNWDDNLRSGFYVGGSVASLSADRNARSFRGTIKPLESAPAGLTLALYHSLAIKDGEQANSSILQELPDPISKVTWDNYLAISPQAAKELGIATNDLVNVTVGNNSVELAAYVTPGLHKDATAIALGYGRSKVGTIGNGVGKSVVPFLIPTSNGIISSGFAVKIEKLGKKYKLASTQAHNMMSPGVLMGSQWKERPLVISAKIQEFKANPSANIPEPEIPKILVDGKLVRSTGANPGFEYKGYRWGMTVDLTQCTGCGACVTACSIENNVPSVGRDEVRVGREMSWMRIDRYFIGDPENPETLEIAHQPVMCQHCENAPCETVCPVAATVHGSEGTNDMVYNRCVGTRYCSNNCPYKVRRFNWMEHWTGTDKAKAPRHLGLNPEVTVRSRGVMEKCNFCASRVAEKKINAKNQGRKLRDGEIQSACQQTCPSDAISFGDINDPNSKVYKIMKDPRSYKMLEYLNVGPSVSYLSRVRSTI
ncbi:TAT-variant-translocated molybdopterin oxidoreductase [Leptospira sp. GIMC2001]|uniref:TAT-variant-translocated molybdopterin oxidoreductase n=1 Tax=Leptospira sp. GIMC2001 TaxID=1513297 RepID=UPI00234B0BD4|nr:TAT-variant-translocated molybdopterin oxidoreductase [Leptospira sp. GIMC2001]WCL48457.1 TAT-variant-translocated molybdopterin oxidoreductase [Leptospira sp. GIMC2001]